MAADADIDSSEYIDGSEGEDEHEEQSADETSVDEALDEALNNVDHNESSFVDSQQNAEDGDDDEGID